MNHLSHEPSISLWDAVKNSRQNICPQFHFVKFFKDLCLWDNFWLKRFVALIAISNEFGRVCVIFFFITPTFLTEMETWNIISPSGIELIPANFYINLNPWDESITKSTLLLLYCVGLLLLLGESTYFLFELCSFVFSRIRCKFFFIEILM